MEGPIGIYDDPAGELNATVRAKEARVVTGSARSSGSGFRTATRAYEKWLRTQTSISLPELHRKHRVMRDSPFAFLRASYYRWAGVWRTVCPDLANAPMVLAVGDLHVENFGTWRDAEGRLAWGINDFDEAARLPYTSDLLRLATSAFLAREQDRLRLSRREICATLLQGYRAGLRSGGCPVVLAERHRKLGERIVQCLVDPKCFWTRKLGKDLRRKPRPSLECRALLKRALPRGAREVTLHSRVAGLGSLGRLRFVAIAASGGARLAREAKALAPSAALWASDEVSDVSQGRLVARLLGAAVRSRDPHVSVSGEWIVRRLAPDSDKITLATLGSHDLETRLVKLMGREVANVHVAAPGAPPAILRDLRRRKSNWLRKAADQMIECVKADHAAW